MIARPLRWFAFVSLVGLLALGVGGSAHVAAQVRPSVAPASPTLTDASAAAPARGVFTVAGQGFTPGGRVYLAIYDQMGAKLYQTRWLTASPQYTITGMSDVSPEAHPIVSADKGVFLADFPRYCGAGVMVRAYDQTTESWSNWVDFDANCQSAGTDHSAAKIG